MASDLGRALSNRAPPVSREATQKVEKRSKAMIQRALKARGYQITTYRANTEADADEFIASAQSIERRHDQQDRRLVERLRVQHSKPVFGRVRMWDLLIMLGQCIDPVDPNLRCVSQLTHSLQVADSMHAAGVIDPDLIVAALIHDLGKLLMLAGEDPSNVVGHSDPIGWHPSGCGLDQCLLHWNHDQIIYIRLKDELPDHLGWLLRYHSIDPSKCGRLMDGRDVVYSKRYLETFALHDMGSKSINHIPQHPIDSYRELIESYFPHPILF